MEGSIQWIIQKINDINRRIGPNETCIYNNGVSEANVPLDANQAVISAAGGGGSGGMGTVRGRINYAGGGGGEGEILQDFIILFQQENQLHFEFAKGVVKGVGEDTWITLLDKMNNIVEQIVLEGGKKGGSGTNNSGGAGGTSTIIPELNGKDGQDGEVTIPSFGSVHGGNGANSTFSVGGAGGYTVDSDPNGKDGRLGCGGGGSSPGATTVGDGGDGFVILSFKY